MSIAFTGKQAAGGMTGSDICQICVRRDSFKCGGEGTVTIGAMLVGEIVPEVTVPAQTARPGVAAQ